MIDARETAHNPQMQHRRFFEVEEHPVTGSHPIPVLPFRFRLHPEPWMRRAAPTLGQHNHEVLGGILGLSDDELAGLEASGIIGTRPVGV